MPPWQFVEAVQGTNAANTPTSTRRITFTAPTKMQPGDQLVAIFASQAAETFVGTSVAWAFVNAFTSPTRGVAVYRRVVTSDEPSSYTFDTSVSQETLGALLVYRGLDNTLALVGSSGVDLSAQTVFPCPARTLARYSDLYIGGVLQVPSVGAVTPPSDAAERIEFTQSALGVTTLRLELFDFAANAVGTTDTKRATTASSSGAAFSIALAGSTAPGPGLSWSPPVAGAIGLPVEGI